MLNVECMVQSMLASHGDSRDDDSKLLSKIHDCAARRRTRFNAQSTFGGVV